MESLAKGSNPFCNCITINIGCATECLASLQNGWCLVATVKSPSTIEYLIPVIRSLVFILIVQVRILSWGLENHFECRKWKDGQDKNKSNM
jgi:hypothetical protein